jgi:hypothetical protein
MAETILITNVDVNVYRQLDSKFEAERFNAFANDIQRKNLRGFLGDALYYSFMEDTRVSGAYFDLLNGKDYTYQEKTVHFYGLKPALVYWFLAIATREGDLFQSGYGAIQLVNNPQQNFETAKEKERIAAGYMETAQEYINDAIKFLDTNADLYPLWESTESEQNTTNFVSFRI